MRIPRALALALTVALAAIAAACGDSSTVTAPPTTAATTPTSTGSTAPATDTPIDGGTLKAGIQDNPDHLDAGLSYTNQGWEILLVTNNGLLTVKKEAGAAGLELVPDLATAMPTVSADNLTYTFTMRSGVMFSAPVSREVLPSDLKFSIERLFRIDSPGVGFYTMIKGADAYSKTKKVGISGIVADDTARTITFTLDHPDGTFLYYLSLAFAFAYPVGTPDADVSTIDAARVATGPYMISKYVPKSQIVIVRNPAFKQWTPDSPNGHLDEIDVQIGVDPERAADMTAAGQLDFSFEPVAPDRYTQLKATSPTLVHDFVRNNTTFWSMNERKPPFDKLAVRQAVNYAIDRHALVKIFGGQGTVTENILPPGFGDAYKQHDLYPYDLAKAKALVASSGTAGMKVTVWSHGTDPAPKAAQYLASVLTDLGYKAGVKILDESVYWDTISAEKTDPQIMFNDFNQDYAEGQDFIDVELNGEGIVDVGNNDTSNSNVPALNKLIDQAKAMPIGPERAALWATLDQRFMAEDVGWAPFMNRLFVKYNSARLRGVVFNTSYYELFTSMWLAPS
jgi:peptide/nickel transport system substrate-binding protein